MINYINEVYINGNKQNQTDYKYYFNQIDNYVNLILNDSLTDCSFMFHECSYITEINFSNFDASFVTDMGYMFTNCLSLTSLDLSNFNTSQVF